MFRKQNKQLMNEQQRTINTHIYGAINEIEDKVRRQVEGQIDLRHANHIRELRKLDLKYADQIRELRAENRRILYELRLMHHCQHFTALLYFYLHRYGHSVLGAMLVLILLICGLIYLLRLNLH